VVLAVRVVQVVQAVKVAPEAGCLAPAAAKAALLAAACSKLLQSH